MNGSTWYDGFGRLSDQALTLFGNINGVLWGQILIYMLLPIGLFFTVATGFVQLRWLFRSWAEMLKGKRSQQGGVTPFQAFVTGVASRVGAGNIAGVAIAVSLGGAGAVFWMWMVALIGMASAFVESSLAQLFKVRHPEDQSFRGGPAYYIELVLKQRWLGVLFALCLICAFGWVFNAVQANTIASSILSYQQIATEQQIWTTRMSIGLVLVALTAPLIFGGIRRISRISEIIVPVMAVMYIFLALVIIFKNIQYVPEVFGLIFKKAFSFEAAGGGILGAIFSATMMQGIKRGLFSNEAGMGSVPNMAATATTRHPVNQGLVQMLGVFFDTIIICTCTALIVLTSGVFLGQEGAKGIQLTQQAVVSQLGDWSGIFLSVAIFFFAFSSIIGNYAYAEANVEFIKKNKLVMFVFRLLVLAMVMLGALAEFPVVWEAADVASGLMAVINLVAIVLLFPYARMLLKDYKRQLVAGEEDPQFSLSDHPGLEQRVPQETREIWR